MTNFTATKWHEQSFARDAYQLADKDFVKSLKTYSARAVIIGTAWLWIQVLVAWSLIFVNEWLAIVSIVMLIAAQQNMATWVHEASHYNLFPDKRTNDLWCNFFFGAPLGMHLKTYRSNHLTHHTYLSSEEDRDRHVHGVDLSGRRLWIEFAKSVVGYYGVRVALGKYLPVVHQRNSQTSEAAPRLPFLAMAALWNGLFLLVSIAAGHWYLYLVLWLYPLFSIAQFINILRTSAEHQPHGYPDIALEDEPLVRTTLPNPLEQWIVYGINFNYHVEHHLWASIPFFNLPKLHQHLVEKGFYKRHPELLQTSGMVAVWKMTRRTLALAKIA